MSDLEQLLASLPIDQISEAIGEDPAAVKSAALAVLPALVGGMQANAQDPAGAASLLDALGQHENDLADAPDLARVDASDGEKIAGHVFGGQQDQVINQLGGTSGVSGGLIRKLLPILAPIVLSFLAKQMSGQTKSGGQGAPDSGVLSSVLEQVLGGAAQGAGGAQMDVGSILTDVLGGLLGGGRR